MTETLQGGITGVALNALGHGALAAMAVGGAAGASEGAGGGLTGLAAGTATLAGIGALAYGALKPSDTPADKTGGKGDIAKA